MHYKIHPAFALFGSVFVACSGGDPTPPTIASPSEGAALTAPCQSCHGQDLAGGNAPSLGSRIYAPNLTPDRETGLGMWTSDQIANAIHFGEDDQGNALCQIMPRFDSMSASETAAIVSYLRSLDAISRSVPLGECPSISTDTSAIDAAIEDPSDDDAGDASLPTEAGCSGYADPHTRASCHGCRSTQSCNPNGCFGNYYCDEGESRCIPNPCN